MRTFKIKSLQQKTVILVLIPTFLLLAAMGWGVFVFARNSLLQQWSETAIANLQRAAHRIDMRLERPKDLVERLKYTSGAGMAHLSLRYTLEQLRELEGVSEVRINGFEISTDDKMMRGVSAGMDFRLLMSDPLIISIPRYKWNNGSQSVSLLSDLSVSDTKETGRLEIKIQIKDLLEKLAKSEWWKSNKTLLIDMRGNIIAHSAYNGDGLTGKAVTTFGSNGLLEELTLAKIQENTSGTVFGKGNPPKEISGFYRLSDAPWYMIVLAPGEQVLKPIFTFRLYYAILFASAVLIIIAFIRSMTTQMTNAIQKVSVAAEDLSNGVFGSPLAVQSNDEIGELTRSFNKMTFQLEQGLKLQEAMGIAREVQQNFLPSSRYVGKDIDIYGASRYCNETGGDFFDLVQFGQSSRKVGAVVGDVVGHGIGAALLMASVRAMVRTRAEQPGDIGEIVTDVNKVLCRDTAASSNFVTLFFIVADFHKKALSWVRAGHDPGFLYYLDRKEFAEIRGKGVAMGIDSTILYETNSIEIKPERQLVVIGSDGAWEAENNEGEIFGKDRLKNLLANHAHERPERIIEVIYKNIDTFLDGAPQQDDITFVVLRINGYQKFNDNM